MSTTLPTTIYIDYKFWTDAFTSLVSLAVAFTALVFTIKQSKATIKHNRLSVTPVICDNLDLFDNTVMYSITNKGLGTAKVNDFRFNYRGTILDFEKFEEEFKKDNIDIIDNSHQFHIATQEDNSYISKDEKIVILKFSFANKLSINKQLKDEKMKELKANFSLEFEYSSLYNNSTKHEFEFKTKK